ncbi:hypothetical protein [Methylobacterium sp. J-076]|uniref:hypothetical protein n=1 Tax=Methylobacterium sp. J-076 TaxID=2836655 RepID=UPI001FBC0327|nr:hypothetical protein [Methylobacterium sp. J-076]MCJ2012010.1 hypothetical protein [Methylobacterium sp. J-076]
MITQPAPPARPGADLAAPRPGAWLVALAAGFLALGLVALAFAVLAVPGPAPAGAAASFRPALAVMAPHTAPVQAPLVHRLDRTGTTVAPADIEVPADPALPGQVAESLVAPGFVAAPFPRTHAALPAPAPLASPLRPPRAA